MESHFYIGNLPNQVTEYDVQKFFQKFGRLQKIILKDRFGFVKFRDLCNIDDVIGELNGAKLRETRVIVEISNCDFKYRNGNVRVNGDSKLRETPYRLAVENLSTLCSWRDLKEMMQTVGFVTFVRAHMTERNKAVVFFRFHDDLTRAISEYQGAELKGLRIKLIDETSPANLIETSRPQMQSSHTTTTISEVSNAVQTSKEIEVDSDSLIEKAMLEFKVYFEENYTNTTKFDDIDFDRSLEDWKPATIEQVTEISQQLDHVKPAYLDIIGVGVLCTIFLIYILFIFN